MVSNQFHKEKHVYDEEDEVRVQELKRMYNYGFMIIFNFILTVVWGI